MVKLAHPEMDRESIQARLSARLNDGSAWRKFLQIAEAQGGDLELLTNHQRLYQAPVQRPVFLSGGPVVSGIDTRQLGLAILALGGGRKLLTDKINPWVGLSGLKRIGSSVNRGEPLAIVHASDDATADIAQTLISKAYTLGETATPSALFEEIS